MQFKQKLKLLINDPSFKRHIPQSPSQQKSLSYPNIFPSQLQIQRFKHLQQARINTIQDIHLGKSVQYAIQKFQQQLINYHLKDQKMESKRKAFFGKLTMDYVEGQMNDHLQHLEKLVIRHQDLSLSIQSQSLFIQKSLDMTEIKKALKMQNNMLKRQNQRLKNQQKKIDQAIASTRR